MRQNDSDENSTVALYCDFENLHASLYESKHGEGSYNKPDVRFKVQEPLVDVQAIVELASSFGPIAINRAYCNWQYCGRYRDALLQSAIELIQLFPPGPSAKNGADIKLCLDATEDLARFPHLGTIIIVGGDSDLLPVSQKIKGAGRTLVGLGPRKSTNRHWAKSCHEFRYYENLAGEEEPQVATAELPVAPPAPVDPAAEMMKRAIKLLAETEGDAWVNKGVDLAHDQTPRLNLRYEGSRVCELSRDGEGARRHLGGQEGRVRSGCAIAVEKIQDSLAEAC